MEYLNGFEFRKVENGYEINGYWGKERECLTLPSEFKNKPIIGIGENAFIFDNIKKIILSDGIKYIKEFAFACCDCEEVVLPNSLKIIAPFAFDNCNLKKINLPEGVREIGDMAFANNDELNLENIISNYRKVGSCLFIEN